MSSIVADVGKAFLISLIVELFPQIILTSQFRLISAVISESISPLKKICFFDYTFPKTESISEIIFEINVRSDFLLSLTKFLLPARKDGTQV